MISDIAAFNFSTNKKKNIQTYGLFKQFYLIENELESIYQSVS